MAMIVKMVAKLLETRTGMRMMVTIREAQGKVRQWAVERVI